MTAPLRIIRDSREQAGYTFDQFPGVTAKTGTLATGDYSLEGFTDQVAIERKELSDLIGSISHDRPRFSRELERLRGYESAALLIEAPFATIRAGAYRSKMAPAAVEQTLISIMQKYRLPVLFADNRQAGEQFVYDFMRHFYRHAVERYKALATG